MRSRPCSSWQPRTRQPSPAVFRSAFSPRAPYDPTGSGRAKVSPGAACRKSSVFFQRPLLVFFYRQQRNPCRNGQPLYKRDGE